MHVCDAADDAATAVDASVYTYLHASKRDESLVNAAHAHELIVRLVDGVLVALKTYVKT